jgi:hypothetical protein
MTAVLRGALEGDGSGGIRGGASPWRRRHRSPLRDRAFGVVADLPPAEFPAPLHEAEGEPVGRLRERDELPTASVGAKA